MFTKIFLVILSLFLIWTTYRYIKRDPKSVSKKNISKSIYTLGWLALILIGFVFLLVLIVKHK